VRKAIVGLQQSATGQAGKVVAPTAQVKKSWMESTTLRLYFQMLQNKQKVGHPTQLPLEVARS
jgi:hypothetical protein